jgi:hypothetical protein
MITHNTMYDFHNVELKSRLESIKEELLDLERRKTNLINYFKSNVCPFKLEDDTDIDTLFAFSPATSNPEKFFNLKLAQYKELVLLIENKKEVEQRLLKYKIPQGIFTYILKRFNELLYQEMIYNKYQFKTLFLGGLYVFCNKNKNKVINWKKSLENKAILLEQGKVPFTKKDEQEAKENGLDYKGEQWLEYLSDYSFFFNWDIQTAQFIRISNIRNYTFMPVRGLASPVAELVKFRNSFTNDEEAINFYKENNYAN